MASLTGQTIASTYDALLKISDNGPINGTLKQITDGLGNNTPLYLSGNTVSIDGSFKLIGRLFDKNNESGVAGQFLVSSGDGVDWQNISESGLITGLGTASFLSKFTAGGVIANSIVSESASGIGIGITATQKLHVLGNGLFTGTLNSSNLSGNNTGDETKVSIETKLGAATSSNDGYLTSTNWSTFNAKQPALNGLGFVKIDGTTISYDNSTYALASRNIATTSPLSGGGDLSANRSLSISKSNSLTDGYLSADDFVNFNSKVPSARTITINGETFDLSANRTYAVNVGVTSFNTRAGAVSLSSLDVTNALGYTPAIDSRIMTINGVGYNLAADRTWSVGTVTSIGTSAPLTGGNITVSGTIGISQSNTTTDGYLSSTDWNTFNNKQANLGYTPENLANKGINNGYASLGGDGKVPSTQLPSYVDDVVEVANFAALPATGETGKIYVTLDNDFVYRWSGSIYVRISSPNAIWGSITGTLSNQIDLQNALNAKVSGVGLDLGTSGTDVNVANSPITSSGNITLNLPTASATNRGLLSSADWTTFNNKQNALTLTTTGTSGASTLVGSTLNIPQYQPQLSGTGFVKISGTTISYDNTTYQPLLTNPVTGSGTLNYIPKFNGTSSLTNSIIQDDGTNTSIGYTTNPSLYKLDVNGTARISQILTINGGTNSTDGIKIIGSLSGSSFTSGIEFIRTNVNSGSKIEPFRDVTLGGVGFKFLTTLSNAEEVSGTLTPALTIASTGAATFSSSVTSNGQYYKNAVIAGSSGSPSYESAYSYGYGSNDFGSLQFFNEYASTLATGFRLKLTNASNTVIYPLIVTSGGNVGIGTTTPDDYGAGFKMLSINGSTAGILQLRSGDSGSINIVGTSTSADFEAFANKTITFKTGNPTVTERMLITSGGNVIIGNPPSDNGAKLQVNGDIISLGSAGQLGFQDRTAGNILVWYATGGIGYLYNSAVGNIATINQTTGAYTALSDISKKKDFEQSKIGLNAILGLKPTLYRMKTDAENTDKHLGFIAQEVKEFIPQAYSESGEGENKFIGLTEMPIIATLVKAIQEQQAQIEELKLLIQNK